MRITILAGLLAVLPNPTAVVGAGEADFSLTLRFRAEKAGEYAVTTRPETWPARKTAVIVCDMWDAHHCLNAVRRENEMVPRTEEFLTTARARGAFIIHAPSGCMAAYQDHPARKRAQAAAAARNLPRGIDQWCSKIPAEEKGTYPIDQSDGGEDDDAKEHAEWYAKLTAMGRNPKAPWKGQHAGLTIRDEDAVSDSGVEVWNLLEARGIDRVMLVGVHTNMCVLGRPFGLRQLAKNGKKVVLVRDLTDTMYNPRMPPMVSHFEGTRLVVEHIEKFVCPTIASDQLLGGKEFRFAGDK
jgi:nicotinamidase-related amidase